MLIGTMGVGKSSVAAALAGLLTTRGIPHARLDLDDVRRAWPAPADDPFHFALTTQNLSCLSTSFVRSGAEPLVLAGVIETRSGLATFSAAIDMPLTVCRLTASPDVLRRRLTARHLDDDEALRWHLARAPELDRILDAALLEACSVDVSTSTVSAAARDVARVVGWLQHPAC
ncbi:hypothetical protein [Nocardioides psychrotolerans]|uniref:hypothetical protein n=1 Tax=Nocardioides psychrotolerans TaxID=1005945 RepID=UPI0011609B19|nr:hypothetical protein [Nocardioides psychrotolerans]